MSRGTLFWFIFVTTSPNAEVAIEVFTMTADPALVTPPATPATPWRLALNIDTDDGILSTLTMQLSGKANRTLACNAPAESGLSSTTKDLAAANNALDTTHSDC